MAGLHFSFYTSLVQNTITGKGNIAQNLIQTNYEKKEFMEHADHYYDHNADCWFRFLRR
jgi:hypothetical protein